MKKIGDYVQASPRQLFGWSTAAVILCGLLLYKLGSLTGGLSAGELSVAKMPVGWHGIYHQPLYLPIQFVRSVIFVLFKHHGQTITRVANPLFGLMAIAAYSLIVRLWHNKRTALLATVLFATSAWVLHVSRLASFDVLYLWSATVVLLLYIALQRHPEHQLTYFGTPLLLGTLLYIPGMVWVVLLEIFWLRGDLATGWKYFDRTHERVLCVVAWLIWLPLLLFGLIERHGIRLWLGLPAHFDSPLQILKHLFGVFVHLFIRGPEYPQLWLGRTPLLDVFTLVTSLIGIQFYLTHISTSRSRFLIALSSLGLALVALNGPVGLSFLVPLLYIAAATGIAYLLHGWLKVFPANPLARNFGIGLVVLTVAVSCLYNVRAYFIAWPHNKTTQATFRYHR